MADGLYSPDARGVFAQTVRHETICLANIHGDRRPLIHLIRKALQTIRFPRDT